jgi:flagellum-specific ATP synthase
VPPPGHAKGGSVTGLYTILVEGDDMTEPVSDAARGILDGHVILSRKLAQKAHYPAIDVLDSISRVADEICEPAHSAARRTLMRALALYREVEDLVQIGAYVRGNNPESDAAIDLNAQINALLRQGRGEQEPFDKSRATLQKLAQALADASARNSKPRGRA